MIGVPAWIFFWQLLAVRAGGRADVDHGWPGRGGRSIVLWWLGLVGAFAVTGVVSDLIQRTPGTLAGTPNNVLVVAGLLVVVAVVVQRRRDATPDQRILLLGLAVFGLFVLAENLASLGVLPGPFRQEAAGFLVLVACLGWIAGRRFFANERQLAALESELETARRIQTSILPRQLPRLPGLSIAARFRPSSAVAGDLYDFLEPAPGQLGIVLADVSGHGVPAALIASMVKVAVTSRRDRAARPAELLHEVNQTLCGSFEHGFVTAAYLHLDTNAMTLVAANAGHPHPLLRRATTRQLLELGGRGSVLGRFPDARFEERRHPLQPGDRLLLYTDGLVEARSPAGELFSEHRLRAFLTDHDAPTPEAFSDALLEELRRWTAASRTPAVGDDLTFLLVDVVSPPPSPAEIK